MYSFSWGCIALNSNLMLPERSNFLWGTSPMKSSPNLLVIGVGRVMLTVGVKINVITN